VTNSNELASLQEAVVCLIYCEMCALITVQEKA